MSNVESVTTIPVIGEYDVVVAGGGMAGFGAACAAARRGMKTLIIERLEILGGLGSGGGVGNFSYGDDTLPLGQGKVFDDIWTGMENMKAIGEENGFRVIHGKVFHNNTYDHNVLPIVLQHLAINSGVELLFSTDVVGANVHAGQIREVTIHNRSLLQVVRGKVFVDGTGDGILSQHAGGKTLPTDDPEHPDFVKPSFMVFLHKRDGADRQSLLGSEPDGLDDLINYSLWPEPDRMGLKLKIYGKSFDTGTGAGYSAATMFHRGIIPGVVRHFQENHDPNYVFEYAPPVFGIREGRRIEGDYVLTGQDVRAGRKFQDSVAYATSCLDSHQYAEKVPPYQIPYRSLIVKDVGNLLVAGRCFSGDRLALSSARVMATGCMMGQAAGVAAALSLQEDICIRRVSPEKIRGELLNGANGTEIMQERLCP